MKMEHRHILRWLLSALVFPLWGMVAGCSGSDGQLPSPEGRKLELRSFSQQLAGADSFSDSVYFAKGNEPGVYTEIWKAHVKGNGSTSLAEPKYYPSDDSRMYLRGFAPLGKPAGAGRIAWSIDGKQDLLLSNEQNGCLTDMFWQEGKSFRFVHLLSQLRFQLRCDEAGREAAWKLFNLAAEGVQKEAVLSLADEKLTFSGDKAAVTVLGGDGAAAGRYRLPDTEWTTVKEMVMIQPGVAVSLTVELKDAAGKLTKFERLPVSFDEPGGFPVAGTSYLLSVVLSADGAYSLSAQVSEWKKGNNGMGIID